MKSRLRRITSSVTRMLLVLLLVLGSLLFATIQGGFVLWFVFFMVIPFALYSFLVFLTPIGHMTVERKVLNKRFVEGDALKVQVTLKRQSWLPILFIVVQEIEPKGAFAELQTRDLHKLLPIGFKRQVSWSYTVPKLARGRHELEGIQVQVADVLGWIQKTKYIEAKKTLIVYPKVENMSFTRRFSQEQGMLGYTSQKQPQQSTMVASIRDYAPGDRMTWLHWSSFAKTGMLYTKEFEYQQSDDVCVVLDTSKGANFEGQISFVASLMQAAHRQKEPVCFLGAGEHRFSLAEFRSENDLEQLMYYLATIEPSIYEPKKIYGHDELVRSSNALMLVTSQLDVDWIDLLKMNATRGSKPIIYVVKPNDKTTWKADPVVEYHAEKAGIQVVYVERGRFSLVGQEGRYGE